MDPGSSAGSGVDGRLLERGRLGSGLSSKAEDLAGTPGLVIGERNLSLSGADRLKAECSGATVVAVV